MELGDYAKPSSEQFSTSKKLHLFKVLLGCLCRLSEGRADWLDSCRLSACAEVLQIWFFISTNSSWLVRGLLRKRESISANMLIFRGVLSLPLNLNPSLRQSFRTQPQNLHSGGEGDSPTNPKSSTPSFWACRFVFFPLSLDTCIHFGWKEDSTQWCVFHLCYQRPHGPRR